MRRQPKTELNRRLTCVVASISNDFYSTGSLADLVMALNSYESTGYYQMEVRTFVCLLYFEKDEDAIYFKMKFG